MPRIEFFSSSTVCDLSDARPEIAEQLRAVGISPLLAGDRLSKFNAARSRNSSAACIVKVEAVDTVDAEK